MPAPAITGFSPALQCNGVFCQVVASFAGSARSFPRSPSRNRVITSERSRFSDQNRLFHVPAVDPHEMFPLMNKLRDGYAFVRPTPVINTGQSSLAAILMSLRRI